MIISEGPDHKQKRGPDPSAQSFPGAQGSSGQAPPPYGANPYSYQPLAPQGPVFVAVNPPEHLGEGATKRFLKAFAVAVFIWFLVATLINSFVDVASQHRNSGSWNPIEVPQREHGRVVQCQLQWDRPTPETFSHNSNSSFHSSHPRPPYHTSMSFTLSSSAHLLYFLTRGDHSWGSIRFEPSYSIPPAMISVSIEARYYTLEALEHVNVCLLERDEGGKGVGIYTPKRLWRRPIQEPQYVGFAIVVRIPSRTPYDVLPLSLDTSLSNFRHEIGSFVDSLFTFESVNLVGTNGAIVSESLPAHYAKLKTSNGAISGKFSTTASLSLIASNGKINADVSLTNERDAHKSTDVTLLTSNALIKAVVSLYSGSTTSRSPSGGHFSVQAVTSNSRTDISFPKSPFSSVLNLSSKTSNAASSVKLPPAFEGSFDLATSNAGTPAVSNNEVPDPSGGGKVRNITLRSVVKNHVSGIVRWVSQNGIHDHRDERELGKVDVKTSNGKVTLSL